MKRRWSGRSLGFALAALLLLLAVFTTAPFHALADTLNVGSTDDADVRSGSPNANFGANAIMDLNDTRDGLVRFDISSIPAGATITSATLTLRATGVGSSTSIKNYGVHRVLVDWDESTVTWNTPGSTAGTHFAASPTDTTDVQTTGSYQWDVTTDVAAFVAGTATDYGWRIIWESNSVGTNKQVDFGTKENTTPANRPVLTVVYSTVVSDTTAPAAVVDLVPSNPSGSSIQLTWTAPGDDGNTGAASSYDVRYSEALITDGNFSAATPATGEPVPSVAGTTESFTISGLSPETTYYFALKTSDEVPNTSGISNVPSLATLASGVGGEEEGGIRQTDLYPSEIEVSVLPDRCTTDPDIQLLLHAHNAARVRIGNLPDLSDGEWVPFEPGTDRTQVFDWTLPEGDGEKTVYIAFKGPFFDLISPIQSVSIKLDEENLCQTAERHAHIVDEEGRIMAVQAIPFCVSDFAHATVEPYLVTKAGPARGWRDLYVRVTSTSPGVYAYAFESGDDFAYDDALVHVSRLERTADVHVESVTGDEIAEVRLRIDAADRGTLDEHVLWHVDVDPDTGFDPLAIDLAKYRELCESDLVPHPHAGELFKSPTSDLYYMGRDQKRHVFPDEDVLRSWFPEDTPVMMVSTYLLAHIPLGDNVTLRPGTFVRIMGEAAIYVVDIGRMLREILSEAFRAILETPPLSELVRILEPSLVTNYLFGPPVTSQEERIGVTEAGVLPGIDDLWPVSGEAETSAIQARRLLDGRVGMEGGPYPAGEPVQVKFRLFDAKGGVLTADDLNLIAGKELHLILIRDNLTDLIHVHPLEVDGLWIETVVFPESGHYYAYIDIDPIAGVPTVLRASLAVGEDPQQAENTALPVPDPSLAYFNNPYRLELVTKNLTSGEYLDLAFQLTKDGEIFSDIGLAFGVPGHIIILHHENQNVYDHVHPAKVPVDGRLEFKTRFPYSGRYTIFAQLNAAGQYLTFPITVDVPAP